MFELIVDSFLDIVLLGRLPGVALAILREADYLFVDELEAVVNEKVFADFVYYKLCTTLEDLR